MAGDPPSDSSSFSGSARQDESQKWRVSPSDVAYHFATSGLSVGVATGVTHPLRCAQSKATNATCWPERSVDWNGPSIHSTGEE
ncbi:hypothetical protein NL676_023404 [Syzygium grande]|nr:hypothetical protein NL676_023404 [Syzygium grande]